MISRSSLDSSAPSSSCNHESVPPTAPGFLQEITFPKDVPIARASKDPLSGPVVDAEVNDVYRYANEGRKVILGPMPVTTFLDDFLPPLSFRERMPKCSGAFNKVPLKPKNEKQIYEALSAAIGNGKRCPSVNFRVTADSHNEYAPDIPQPEICGYDVSIGAPVVEGGVSDEDAPLLRRCLGFAELFAMVRKGGDPFCDNHTHDQQSKSIYKSFFSFENRRYQQESDFDAGREEKRNLGRAVGYVSIACSRQHRASYFSILIFGTHARLMRWDRAGGIVTAAFDYRRQPGPLCEFLWRFHHASPVQRGYDPTVTVASRAEEELFRESVRRHAALQLGLKEPDAEADEALTLHYESGKVMRMQAYDHRRQSFQTYLVSTPLSAPRSAVGRSTRAYWAVERDGSNAGEVRFMKDLWRLDAGGVKEEGLTYGEMEEGRVKNVCDLETFGDVRINDMMTDIKDGDEDQLSTHRTRQKEESFTTCRKFSAAGSSSQDPEMKLRPDVVQCTRTNDYRDELWVCECLRHRLDLRVHKHTHCRLVLKQAGYPLRTFKGSRELFGGIKDALEALDSAYKRCGKIHRDVSLDNIILYRDEANRRRRGLLVDWEFSAVVDNSGKSTDGLHTGTWAFMPTRILRNCRDFNQTQADDMESLFYVAMYGCLRWLPLRHTAAAGLGRWIYLFFYELTSWPDGHDSGGREKYIQQASSGFEFLGDFEFENGCIQSFFKIGYKYLATTHTALKSRGAPMLWTMDNFMKLCTSVYDSLSSDESTTCDRTENDVSDYFPMAYGDLPGTQTCLVAGAVRFHANGTSRVPSKRILEEATDDPLVYRETVRTGRKRMRLEPPDRAGGRRKRAARGQKMDGTRLENPSSFRDESQRRMYSLRSRWLKPGSFSSSQGSRRSARLALKRTFVGSKPSKHN